MHAQEQRFFGDEGGGGRRRRERGHLNEEQPEDEAYMSVSDLSEVRCQKTGLVCMHVSSAFFTLYGRRSAVRYPLRQHSPNSDAFLSVVACWDPLKEEDEEDEDNAVKPLPSEVWQQQRQQQQQQQQERRKQGQQRQQQQERQGQQQQHQAVPGSDVGEFGLSGAAAWSVGLGLTGNDDGDEDDDEEEEEEGKERDDEEDGKGEDDFGGDKAGRRRKGEPRGAAAGRLGTAQLPPGRVSGRRPAEVQGWGGDAPAQRGTLGRARAGWEGSSRHQVRAVMEGVEASETDEGREKSEEEDEEGEEEGKEGSDAGVEAEAGAEEDAFRELQPGEELPPVSVLSRMAPPCAHASPLAM